MWYAICANAYANTWHYLPQYNIWHINQGDMITPCAQVLMLIHNIIYLSTGSIRIQLKHPILQVVLTETATSLAIQGQPILSALVRYSLRLKVGSSPLRKSQIIIWDFSNSEPQETHFYSFYSVTSLLLWRITLHNIVLIFF